MPPAPMQTVDWFPRPKGPSSGHGLLSSALKAAVGVGVGALFYTRGHVILGAVAAGLAIAFFLVSLSAGGRAVLAKVLGFVGEWAGRIVGTVLLGAIFLLVLTPARLVRRLAGADDLHMRSRGERSFWLPCDAEEHKRKYAGAMFATEVASAAGGRRGVLVLVALAALFVASEIVLRIQGYGHPLTYVSNPSIGYLPAPGQRTTWRGARLETNHLGMRAPERDVAKGKGTLRILELGTEGGLEIDQGAIHARVAEKKLAERAGGRPVEVWNIDVEGWGMASARGFVSAFGALDADAAVITVAPGALLPPKQSVLYTGFSPAERPPRLALEERFLHWLWEYRAERTVNAPALLEIARAEGIAAAADLTVALRAKGIDVLFVILPPPSGDAAIGDLRARVERAGGLVRELPKAFAERAFDRDTTDLTAEGHAALGDETARILTSDSPKVRAFLEGRGP